MLSYPIITLAMPIRDRAWALPYVLKSIESQDYPKNLIKMVFVDNYSKDETYDILAEWKEKMEKYYYKIVLIREEGTIPSLRNRCISLAEGNYILFWDSDIIAPAFMVRRMVELADLRRDAGIVVAEFQYADIEYIPVIEALEDRQLKAKEVLGAGTGFTLIRMDVFSRAGNFNEKLTVGEDTEFSYRVLEKTQYKILQVDVKVLHLKHRDKIIPRVHQGFVKWLQYNFYYRSSEYLSIYYSLPKYLKIRLIYWLMFPLFVCGGISILALLPYNLLKGFIAAIVFLYLSLSIYPNVTRNGFWRGLITWIKFNLPTGLALSYGFLLQALRVWVRK